MKSVTLSITALITYVALLVPVAFAGTNPNLAPNLVVNPSLETESNSLPVSWSKGGWEIMFEFSLILYLVLVVTRQLKLKLPAV